MISAYSVAGIRQEYIPVVQKKSTAENIIHAVCEYFKIDKNHLFQKQRLRKLVYPRQIAMYLMTRHTDLTLEEISNQFGKASTDHTTVIHSRNKIKDDIKVNNGNTREDLDNILYQLFKIETIKHH